MHAHPMVRAICLFKIYCPGAIEMDSKIQCRCIDSAIYVDSRNRTQMTLCISALFFFVFFENETVRLEYGGGGIAW